MALISGGQANQASHQARARLKRQLGELQDEAQEAKERRRAEQIRRPIDTAVREILRVLPLVLITPFTVPKTILTLESRIQLEAVEDTWRLRLQMEDILVLQTRELLIQNQVDKLEDRPEPRPPDEKEKLESLRRERDALDAESGAKSDRVIASLFTFLEEKVSEPSRLQGDPDPLTGDIALLIDQQEEALLTPLFDLQDQAAAALGQGDSEAYREIMDKRELALNKWLTYRRSLWKIVPRD